MQTILITGGSGLLGTYLSKILLQKGYKVIILGRLKKEAKTKNLSYAVWNLDTQTIDEDCIVNADVIINLAGANVGSERWTKARKQEIVDSRVKAGNLLVKALQNTPNNVRTFIQASATGWYKKHDSNKPNIEEEKANTDFLGNTCQLWEESVGPIKSLNKRLVILRFGIILSNLGGAFKEFKKPLNFRFAPILGNGNQFISWLHIHDAAMAILFALEQNNLQGIYNTVSPNVTSNKKLILTLAKKVCNKIFIPFYVPSFLLKIVLGEMSEEVLKTTNASSKKLESAGFTFTYPTIESTIDHLVENKEV